MGLFTKNVFTAKQMKFKDFKHSPVMKKLLADKNVSKVLDKRSEREEFYDRLKTRSGNDGVNLNDIRTALGDLRSGRGKNINEKEAQLLAGALKKEGIIPDQGSFTKSYIFKPEDKKESLVQNNIHQDNIHQAKILPENNQKQPPTHTAFSSSNLKKMDSRLSSIVHTADKH